MSKRLCTNCNNYSSEQDVAIEILKEKHNAEIYDFQLQKEAEQHLLQKDYESAILELQAETYILTNEVRRENDYKIAELNDHHNDELRELEDVIADDVIEIQHLRAIQLQLQAEITRLNNTVAELQTTVEENIVDDQMHETEKAELRKIINNLQSNNKEKDKIIAQLQSQYIK